MKIFDKKSGKQIELGSTLLQKRTQSILDMFTTTIANLTQVISETKEQISQRQSEIEAAIAEKSKLEEIAVSNEAIINKIKGIITPEEKSQAL